MSLKSVMHIQLWLCAGFERQSPWNSQTFGPRHNYKSWRLQTANWACNITLKPASMSPEKCPISVTSRLWKSHCQIQPSPQDSLKTHFLVAGRTGMWLVLSLFNPYLGWLDHQERAAHPSHSCLTWPHHVLIVFQTTSSNHIYWRDFL